jgi:hypothetical protein
MSKILLTVLFASAAAAQITTSIWAPSAITDIKADYGFRASVITTIDESGEFKGDMTMAYGCTKQGKKPICVYSINGPAMWSSVCSDHSDYTTTTFDRSFEQGVQNFCLTGSLLPESIAIFPRSLGASDIQTYPVTVISRGQT